MMLLQLAKSLLRSFAVILVVTFTTFALMYGNADGIARSVLGLKANDEQIAAKTSELGLDRPLLVQYGDWLAGAIRGDLGSSFYTSESVADALSNRAPVTLTILVITLVLAAVFSVVLGVTAAVKGGWVDRIVQLLTVLANAVPAYVVAIVFVFVFAVAWRALPATGYVAFAESPAQWAASIALPTLTLLVGAIAGIASQFRTAVLDTLGRDFVRTLRARGVSERELIFRNVLRNSAAPGLTAISLTMIGLLGGAVFIEQVFALPGMGQLANNAALISDVPMVMGTVLVTILIVIVVNLLGDLGVTLLNPKARTR